MLAEIGITAWHWCGFVVAVLVFLALDLGVFHRGDKVTTFRGALIWTLVLFGVTILFGTVIAPAFVSDWDREEAIQFVTGYVIEFSLSMDNVFVIALIFAYFGVPRENQRRVLFWGITGALLMRGLMILLGSAIISRFHWMLYVLGGFLIFTGIKMLAGEDPEVHPDKNIFIQTARKVFPVSSSFDGAHFVTRVNNRTMLTPLALVLLMVETTDLIFAVDSIPAIFAITQKPFIVFTSNIFAILGLRSLYFVLSEAIAYFRYLKIGLSLALCIIGAKMLIAYWFPIPTAWSLIAVGLALSISIAASIIVGRREARARAASKTD